MQISIKSSEYLIKDIVMCVRDSYSIFIWLIYTKVIMRSRHNRGSNHKYDWIFFIRLISLWAIRSLFAGCHKRK